MASYASWQFVLTDLSGNQLGEVLDCPQRQVTRSISAPSTASFTAPVTTQRLSDILTKDMNLKVYRNRLLLFHGPVISAELAGEDATGTPTVAVGAADPSWRFSKRLAGKSQSGTAFTAGPPDRLTIAETLINTANTESIDGLTSHTGVAILGQTCGSTASYIAGPYKPLDQCIADMSQTLAGFDWRIDPVEYSSGVLGNFKAAALLGSTQTGAVFEYQGKANARVPNYQRGITDSANKVYSIPDGGPADAALVREAHDNTSVTARGRYEDVVDTSNITVAAHRDAVLNDHILYRKNPKQVLSFSPDFNDYTGRVPEYGVDYQIGDSVRARVLYNGVQLIDGYVRVYKMQFDIDANSKETLTPTVVNET
jgi:hypothetical protein